jgi:hypothetical protein
MNPQILQPERLNKHVFYDLAVVVENLIQVLYFYSQPTNFSFHPIYMMVIDAWDGRCEISFSQNSKNTCTHFFS